MAILLPEDIRKRENIKKFTFSGNAIRPSDSLNTRGMSQNIQIADAIRNNLDGSNGLVQQNYARSLYNGDMEWSRYKTLSERNLANRTLSDEDRIINRVLKRDLKYEGEITNEIRNNFKESLSSRGLTVNRDNLLSTFENFGRVEGKPGYEDYLRDQGLKNTYIDAGRSTKDLAQEARNRGAVSRDRWIERAARRKSTIEQAALAREQAVIDADIDYRKPAATPKALSEADIQNERLSRGLRGEATTAEKSAGLLERMSNASGDVTDYSIKSAPTPGSSVGNNVEAAAAKTRSSLAKTRMAGFNPEGSGYQEQIRNAYRNRRYQFFEANKGKLKDMNWAQRQMSFMEDLQSDAKNQSLFGGQFAGKNTDDLVAFANRQQMGIENTYTIESAIKKRMAENISEDEAAALNARLAKLKVGRGRIASGDVVSHATEHIKYKPKVPAGPKGGFGVGKVMGIVGAVAALGTVASLMFRGGQQTNAQLYNPGMSYANY